MLDKEGLIPEVGGQQESRRGIPSLAGLSPESIQAKNLLLQPQFRQEVPQAGMQAPVQQQVQAPQEKPIEPQPTEPAQTQPEKPEQESKEETQTKSEVIE
jgi:hypothetical protein